MQKHLFLYSLNRKHHLLVCQSTDAKTTHAWIKVDLYNFELPVTMSSKISLQTPYVVAPLPRPIDRATGRYVVGDVYGGAVGSKKRKRSELAIGVDGEGVNIYDVSLGSV